MKVADKSAVAVGVHYASHAAIHNNNGFTHLQWTQQQLQQQQQQQQKQQWTDTVTSYELLAFTKENCRPVSLPAGVVLMSEFNNNNNNNNKEKHSNNRSNGDEGDDDDDESGGGSIGDENLCVCVSDGEVTVDGMCDSHRWRGSHVAPSFIYKQQQQQQ